MALVLLTGQPDLETAYGAARQFWMRARDRWGDLTYFCWLELTQAGAPHYHALVVNPPPGFYSRETKAWLEWAWGNRFVKLKKRDADWFERQAGAYVGQYAKKFGHKDYQQDYDEVPRELRTFMSNRTAHPLEELREHESKWLAVYIGDQVDAATHSVVEPYIRLDGRDVHHCAPGGLRHVTKSEDFRRRGKPLREAHRNGGNVGQRRARLPGQCGPPRDFSDSGRSSEIEGNSDISSYEGGGIDQFLAGPLRWSQAIHGHKQTPGANSLARQAPGAAKEVALCPPQP